MLGQSGDWGFLTEESQTQCWIWRGQGWDRDTPTDTPVTPRKRIPAAPVGSGDGLGRSVGVEMIVLIHISG